MKIIAYQYVEDFGYKMFYTKNNTIVLTNGTTVDELNYFTVANTDDVVIALTLNTDVFEIPAHCNVPKGENLTEIVYTLMHIHSRNAEDSGDLSLMA